MRACVCLCLSLHISLALSLCDLNSFVFDVHSFTICISPAHLIHTSSQTSTYSHRQHLYKTYPLIETPKYSCNFSLIRFHTISPFSFFLPSCSFYLFPFFFLLHLLQLSHSTSLPILLLTQPHHIHKLSSIRTFKVIPVTYI